MKVLFITRMKDTFALLPKEQQEQILQGAGAFIEKYRRTGACKEIYAMPNEKASVSIWELESGEQMGKFSIENPASPFQDFEMYVLSDFEALMRGYQEAYQKQLLQV